MQIGCGSTQVHLSVFIHLYQLQVSKWLEICWWDNIHLIQFNILFRLTLSLFQSILIHGSNSTSLAAITVALHCGSNVYVAIETIEKKNHVIDVFDKKIKAANVLLIQDGAFYINVLRQTAGKGWLDCQSSLHLKYYSVYD